MRAVFTADEEFSDEYGSGGDADVYGRRAGAVGEAGNSGAGRDYGARASLVCAIAAGGLQAARLRSAVEFFRDFVHGLCDADQRADREAVCGAAPAGEKGAVVGRERGGETDCLLSGSRSAGADSVGTAGGSAVVGAGVRSGGIQERVSRRADAGGRGPDGFALQRDPVDSSCDARMVVWGDGDRSAHGRNYQGARFAGIAAGAAGLFDRGGFAGAVCGWQGVASGTRSRTTNGAGAAAAVGGARSGAHAGPHA